MTFNLLRVSFRSDRLFFAIGLTSQNEIFDTYFWNGDAFLDHLSFQKGRPRD